MRNGVAWVTELNAWLADAGQAAATVEEASQWRTVAPLAASFKIIEARHDAKRIITNIKAQINA
jgi:hypothetical protein